MESEVYSKAKAAHDAAYVLATTATDVKNKALLYIAEELINQTDAILAANAEDLARAREKGMAPAMLDRLGRRI